MTIYSTQLIHPLDSFVKSFVILFCYLTICYHVVGRIVYTYLTEIACNTKHFFFGVSNKNILPPFCFIYIDMIFAILTSWVYLQNMRILHVSTNLRYVGSKEIYLKILILQRYMKWSVSYLSSYVSMVWLPIPKI